ncbi:hypothetical protein GCM10023185_32210 [Hymenobacter saemangeumensis]|uniref:Uncharacterized protein n=1 Tax=Hymenobacter saemangeumensis TaxID=1084522 RepID=A0ABP8IN72_9BACT
MTPFHWRLPNKWAFPLCGIIFLAAGFIVVRGFVTTPKFLFGIKDEMIKNHNFNKLVGEHGGYSIWFDRDKSERTDTVDFKVTMLGQNDSAFVQILGHYYSSDGEVFYEKTDTIFNN